MEKFGGLTLPLNTFGIGIFWIIAPKHSEINLTQKISHYTDEVISLSSQLATTYL